MPQRSAASAVASALYGGLPGHQWRTVAMPARNEQRVCDLRRKRQLLTDFRRIFMAGVSMRSRGIKDHVVADCGPIRTQRRELQHL